MSLKRADGKHIHDPAGLANVLRCWFGAQRPGDVTALADLVSSCHKGNGPLSLELVADQAVQDFLVALVRQQEVGSLLLELVKNIRSPQVAPFGSVTPTTDLLQKPQNLDREMTFRCRDLFGGLPPSKNMHGACCGLLPGDK